LLNIDSTFLEVQASADQVRDWRIRSISRAVLPQVKGSDDEPEEEIRLRHVQVELRSLWTLFTHETGILIN
jgi:hypothetical protein